jgi:hypothetical protein
MPGPRPPPFVPARVSSVPFLGQAEAVAVLDLAINVGVGWVLLLGPEGSGKTAYLKDLERRGLGHYVHGPAGIADAPAGKRLLLDGLELLPAEEIEKAFAMAGKDSSRQVIVAFRGWTGTPSLELQGDDAMLPVFTTHQLVEATGGRLPVAAAEQIEATAIFKPPGVEDLVEIGRRMVAARGGQLVVPDELVTALAKAAARSPRGGHELRALVMRIPAGAWKLRTDAKGGA